MEAPKWKDGTVIPPNCFENDDVIPYKCSPEQRKRLDEIVERNYREALKRRAKR